MAEADRGQLDKVKARFRKMSLKYHPDKNIGREEAALAAYLPLDASVVARTGLMKRVGLLRLLRDLYHGRGAYPLADGIDDMVCDYHLEKIGIWWDTPFTNPRSKPAQLFYRCLSYLGG